MKARYASCQSYEDRGVLVTQEVGSADAKPRTLTFRTLFDRSAERFLFAYTKTDSSSACPSRNVTWQVGPGLASTWWTLDGKVQQQELDALLASVAGVSEGLTRILIPQLRGRPQDSFTFSYYLGADVQLNGVPTYHLIGDTDASQVHVWVRRTDLAVLRMTRRYRVSAQRALEPQLEAQMRQAGVPLEPFEGGGFTLPPFTQEARIDFEPVFDQPLAKERFEFTPPAASDCP